MKEYFLLTCLLLATAYCSGQVDSTAVPLVSYWSMGDSYDFRVTKINRQTKSGELVKDDSTSYEVKWEVMDSTETDYTIRYAFQSVGILPGGHEISKELSVAFNEYPISDIIYRTTELGEFIEVVNWKEVADAMTKVFDLTEDKVISEYPEKVEMAENIFDMLKQSMTSQAGIEELFLGELRCMHFPFGYEYSINDSLEYEDELPNLFGGKPFSAAAKIWVEEVDPEDEYFVLIQELTVNPDDVILMVRYLLERMKLSSAELEAEMQRATVDMRDYNVFAYFYYPGVPVFIQFNREIFMEIGNIQSYKEEITRVELMVD